MSSESTPAAVVADTTVEAPAPATESTSAAAVEEPKPAAATEEKSAPAATTAAPVAESKPAETKPAEVAPAAAAAAAASSSSSSSSAPASAPAEQMQALYLTKHAAPTPDNKSGAYVVGPQPKPTIQAPKEILIKVHAASINPIGQLGVPACACADCTKQTLHVLCVRCSLFRAPLSTRCAHLHRIFLHTTCGLLPSVQISRSRVVTSK